MTSCDLVKGLIAGDASHIGLFDWGPWTDTLDRWVKEGYPVEEGAGNSAPKPVSHSEHFDYDMMSVGGWFKAQPLPDVEETVKEDAEWKYVRNGAGAVWRYPRHGVGSVPELVECTMTERAVWDREYRDHLLSPDRARIRLEPTQQGLRRQTDRGKWTFYSNSFIWERMRECMGTENMLMNLCLDPEWIHDFCRVYTDFYKAHYRILFEEVGTPDGIWMLEDLAYKNGLTCSPQMLDQIIFPYYREMIAFFREYDLPVFLHSDGRIDEALPLIIDAGFVGINPIDLKAGCDLFRFAEEHGDDLIFVGGFDTRVLESGNRDAIEREVARVTAGMRERGARYIFGVDHTIPPTVALRDFEFAMQCFREHSGG